MDFLKFVPIVGSILSQRGARNRAADERLRIVRDIAQQTQAELNRCPNGDDYWDIYVGSFEPLKKAAASVLEDVANQPTFTAVLDRYLSIPRDEFGLLVGPRPPGYRSGKDQATEWLKKLITFAKR